MRLFVDKKSYVLLFYNYIPQGCIKLMESDNDLHSHKHFYLKKIKKINVIHKRPLKNLLRFTKKY